MYIHRFPRCDDVQFIRIVMSCIYNQARTIVKLICKKEEAQSPTTPNIHPVHSYSSDYLELREVLRG